VLLADLRDELVGDELVHLPALDRCERLHGSLRVVVRRM
jgi:hypothetical protein